MKKIAIIGVIVICIISIFAFSACEDSQKYEKIELTKDNVFEYLSFSVEITNCIAIPLSDGNYDLSCTAVITTSPAVNCTFVGKETTDSNSASGAYISYDYLQLPLYGWTAQRQFYRSTTNVHLSSETLYSYLDFNGRSSISISFVKESSYSLNFPTSFQITSKNIDAVFGNALVPKESA